MLYKDRQEFCTWVNLCVICYSVREKRRLLRTLDTQNSLSYLLFRKEAWIGIHSVQENRRLLITLDTQNFRIPLQCPARCAYFLLVGLSATEISRTHRLSTGCVNTYISRYREQEIWSYFSQGSNRSIFYCSRVGERSAVHTIQGISFSFRSKHSEL